MDRGIDYTPLTDFINANAARGDTACKLRGTARTLANLIILPDTGARIAENITSPALSVYPAAHLEEAVRIAVRVTRNCCLFSPAAASYGFFKNFEERGDCFKELVRKYAGS